MIKSSTIYYRVLATQLKDGARVFLPDVERKQAFYMRKRFSKLVGKEVLGYPVQVSGKDGYLFHLRKAGSSEAS